MSRFDGFDAKFDVVRESVLRARFGGNGLSGWRVNCGRMALLGTGTVGVRRSSTADASESVFELRHQAAQLGSGVL